MTSSITRCLVGMLFLPLLCFSQETGSDSLHANGRGIQIFDGQIHPHLPTYSFAVVRDRDNFISEIRISQKGSHLIQQVLPVDAAQPPGAGSDYLHFEDLNFDGYKDLTLFNWEGSGGEGELVWLFDPRTAQFVFNELLSNLPNIEPHAEDSSIVSCYHEGWMSQGCRVYRYEADSLVLVRSESTDWIEKEQHFLRVIRIRQNGVMIDTLRQVIKRDDH